MYLLSYLLDIDTKYMFMGQKKLIGIFLQMDDMIVNQPSWIGVQVHDFCPDTITIHVRESETHGQRGI